MIFEFIKLSIDVTEDEFNEIYSERIRMLAKRHWTPVRVAKQACEFLADRPGTKVLDIGSGVGKFCMIGATHTKGYFTGVEARRDFVDLSHDLADRYEIKNVSFVHSNITSVAFKDYDAFYFFNSFYENIATEGKIDDTVSLDTERYLLYSVYIYEQFYDLPIGTRLVTYHSPLKIIPSSYQLQFSSEDELLTFWEKTK